MKDQEQKSFDALKEKIKQGFFVSAYGNAEYVLNHKLRPWVQHVVALCYLEQLPPYHSSVLPADTKAFDLRECCNGDELVLIQESGLFCFDPDHDYFTFVLADDLEDWANEEIDTLAFRGMRFH